MSSAVIKILQEKLRKLEAENRYLTIRNRQLALDYARETQENSRALLALMACANKRNCMWCQEALGRIDEKDETNKPSV